MINNLEKISKLLKFDSEDEFYHLQIIKRKKEHPELGSNSYLVKTYYISSLEYLLKKWEEIITLSTLHNARACINLNRRSFEKIAFQMLQKVTNQIMNKDYRSVRKAYESVCGAHSNESEKKWIVDIDTHSSEIINTIAQVINTCMPLHENKHHSKIYVFLPTKAGGHLISEPFNVQEFKEKLSKLDPVYKCDLHPNNPTILFIP